MHQVSAPSFCCLRGNVTIHWSDHKWVVQSSDFMFLEPRMASPFKMHTFSTVCPTDQHPELCCNGMCLFILALVWLYKGYVLYICWLLLFEACDSQNAQTEFYPKRKCIDLCDLNQSVLSVTLRKGFFLQLYIFLMIYLRLQDVILPFYTSLKCECCTVLTINTKQMFTFLKPRSEHRCTSLELISHFK